MKFIRRKSNPKDIILALILFIIGFSGSYMGSSQVYLDGVRAHDVWFQADIGRVYANMTERWSDHYRTKVHPLFSLATQPVVETMSRLGMEKKTSVRVYVATVSGIWLVLIFSILRLLGIARFDTILFSMLAALSAASFFWITVPETYLFGSVSMLVVTVLMIISSSRTFSPTWYASLSAVSLSMTVTNWMAGMLATLLNHSYRRSIRITLDAFLIVTVLWAVQHVFYRSSVFFLFSPQERHYLLMDAAGGVLEKALVFFVYVMIMPTVQVLGNQYAPDWPRLSIQFSSLTSSGVQGMVMMTVWISLLIVGAGSILRMEGQQRKFGLFLSLMLLGQFTLHLVYGDETFLYSLHWLPFLVMLAAMGLFSSYRRYVLMAACGLIIGAGVNNLRQFTTVTDELHRNEYGSSHYERSKLLSMMQAYPNAEWPRGEGHVILAATGSSLSAKGYHEPGGSFSPGFGSFGIAFVFFNAEGELQASSNSIAMSEISQALQPERQGILTKTPYYQAEWRVNNNGFNLYFSADAAQKKSISALRISSAGPAGGPIKLLHWDGHSLRVNNQYRLQFSQPPKKVLFLDERSKPLLITDLNTDSWVPEDGYGSAILVLENGVEHEIRVIDESSSNHAQSHLKRAGTMNIRALPDQDFVDSLSAQIFHLKAGIINNETRPGDPGNYHVNWLRDGAYSIVALARAGELSLARKLLIPFATEDFFGGFGAESDSPGLALWAMEEVSARLRQAEFDRWLWSHVLRKTDLIIEMLDTKVPVYKSFSGPVVPDIIVSEQSKRTYKYLSKIADPAWNGLITGKMDFQEPVFYVNAVSYLGLMRAADLAIRLGYTDKASALRLRAEQLRVDWEKALDNHPDRDNERTLISGIWPSGIIDQQRDLYESLLEKNWHEQRTDEGHFVTQPLWTYFEAAEAHQWLLLGKPDRAWSTLTWFLKNQASPGLYTWWEGDTETNTFHLWETVRGWYKPEHVTPHYWTAAEIALLQLDMLAYESRESGIDSVMIGAGIKKAWLDKPFSVSGLLLRGGQLDWHWDGNEMTAVWYGENIPSFSTGTAFPPSTPIKVSTAPAVSVVLD